MNKKIQDISNVKYFSVFFFLGLVLIIFGLNTTPDSFAYIDGAKNVIDNGKYVYDSSLFTRFKKESAYNKVYKNQFF